jgi:predicted TIM-barrel fold metal-dependent hydrolase
MTKTHVHDRPVDDDIQEIKLIDCDIHPLGGPSGDPLLTPTPPSFGERREHVKRYGPRFADWSTHCYWYWQVVRREDATPEEGESMLDLLRRQVLDLYKVDYGIMNPEFINPWERNAPELEADRARALNDRLIADFLQAEPRLLGTIIVPWEHPDLAIREIERRATERECWAQVGMPSEAMEPLGSRKYWPIYEAATAHGFPVAAHIGFYDDNRGTGWPSYVIERHLALASGMRRQLLGMVCDGLFDAVPGVRIVLVEGGVSWAVSLRWALDSAFDLLGDEVQLDRRPSEYLDECVWFTTQPIEEPDDPRHFAQAVEHGRLTDRLLFSTDYPHFDFDSPKLALPSSLPKETIERIMSGNACELYGLPR